jgi:hypothetical protein
VADLQHPHESDLPTPADVASYREHGWFVTAPIIPHDLLDEMAQRVVEHQQRPDAERLRSSVGHEDWRPGDDAGVQNSEFLTYQQPAFGPVTLAPLIGAIAARLAGTGAVRLFDDQAVVKQPDDGEAVIGWHTDSAYWSTCTSRQMLTAWIPLADTTEESGTLMVVDGSHLWQTSEHLRLFHDRNLGRLGDVVGREVAEDSIVPIALRKGQVSFHHMRLMHASGPNRSARPRMVLSVHLQPEDNEYRSALSDAGRPVHLADDDLCRRTPDGRPDYSDPDVFPVIWSQSTARAAP